jgi:hypothetical protein
LAPTGDALVRFSDTLYLIFKLAAALWQPFNYNIWPVRRVQGTYKKHTLTNLEFVLGHDALPLYKGNMGERLILAERCAAGDWTAARHLFMLPTTDDLSTSGSMDWGAGRS